MNKMQSLSAMSKATGLSRRELQLLFAQVAAVVALELRSENGSVMLPGLGRFKLRTRNDGQVAPRFLVLKQLKEEIKMR